MKINEDENGKYGMQMNSLNKKKTHTQRQKGLTEKWTEMISMIIERQAKWNKRRLLRVCNSMNASGKIRKKKMKRNLKDV